MTRRYSYRGRVVPRAVRRLAARVGGHVAYARHRWFIVVQDVPLVCPGCYAVGGERCAPWCIDAEIAEERASAFERGDYDGTWTDDEGDQ